MKKVHMIKNETRVAYRDGKIFAKVTNPLPVCKVHNKTYIYKGTRKWDGVTCEKCLKYK